MSEYWQIVEYSQGGYGVVNNSRTSAIYLKSRIDTTAVQANLNTLEHELAALRAENARLRSAAEVVLVATVLGGRGKLVPIDSSNALEALRRALESYSAESEA
jgi:hypothetical protein